MKGEAVSAQGGGVKGAHRFPVLDALRGVAAVAVVVFHGSPYMGRGLVAHGNLAVDFFFMLSGFVLTLAYQRRLDEGWSLGAFMKVRAIRLYPLYALGLLLGCVTELARVLGGGKGISPGLLVLFLALGSLMLPVPPPWGAGVALSFPLNIPAWSLFAETVANVLHALFLRRRGWGVLAGVVVTACAVLLWGEVHRGTVYLGPMIWDSGYAVVRVMVSYPLGMLLYRVWAWGGLKLTAPAVGVAAVLLTMLVIPTVKHEIAYELVAMFGVFPLMLLAGARSQLSRRMVGVATALGQASYAVYVLHVPVANGMHVVWSGVRHRSMEKDAPWSGVVYVVVVFLLALLLDSVYDVPVRAWLQRRFGEKKPARPLVT